MSKYTDHSPRASLAAVGVWCKEKGRWNIVRAQVQIAQTIRHSPTDKLLDAMIGILAGGSGVDEVNTRVRPDGALQRAFGRTDCAEQSTISETLSACTTEYIGQMRSAIRAILEDHGACRNHDFAAEMLRVDIDMTGMPTGRNSEGVSKGYSAGQPNCRGRQLGRVLATAYEEIVVDQLYDGKRQLTGSLPDLVEQAEATLHLDDARRARTILRIDGGGGTDQHIDWLLGRGYPLLVKMFSSARAANLATSVRRWHADPKVAGRQIGWIEAPHPYAAVTRQIAMRTPKEKGSGSYHALVTTVDDTTLFRLAGQPKQPKQPKQSKPSQQAVLITASHDYDLRGGGLETQNRGDKQGLALTHRNKRRFAAQEVLVLHAQLAHNIAIWGRNAIARHAPAFAHFGIQRIIRGLFRIPGAIHYDDRGRLIAIAFNPRHPYARPLWPVGIRHGHPFAVPFGQNVG